MAKKKTARPKKRGAATAAMHGDLPSVAKTPYRFRGRTIEIVPQAMHHGAMPGHDHGPGQGMLRVDGRDVMYEQTDEGVYSHELMYQRFSTPEELAEELVRQWGTHIPAPPPMSMPMPATRGAAAKPGPRGRRR